MLYGPSAWQMRPRHDGAYEAEAMIQVVEALEMMRGDDYIKKARSERLTPAHERLAQLAPDSWSPEVFRAHTAEFAKQIARPGAWSRVR